MTTGWGLGVYHPETTFYVGGFSRDTRFPAVRTTIRPATFSPIQTEVLDHNIVYEYEYDLILGSLDEIRQWVYAHHADPRPDYQFTKDRQHWYCTKGDAGFPLDGAYRVYLDGNDPIMRGPTCAFLTEEVATLYISAAYHLQDDSHTRAQLFWDLNNEGVFSEEQSIRFDIIPDGEYHTYKIELNTSTAYRGLISQLRFDPISRGQAGDYVDIRYISFYDVPEPCGFVLLIGAVILSMFSGCGARRCRDGRG